MATPSPQTWTIRFKARKTTVLLHIDPLDTFTAIKTCLLDALQETGLKDPDTGDAITLPESPADIQLGRPVDIHDAQQGFRLGEWEITPDGEEDEEQDDPKGKGKGKGKAKATPKKTNGAAKAGTGGAKDCPKGAGLKDGAVLAFRWVGDGIWDGEQDEEGEGDMWGVNLASFEDAYGVENEGDVGGAREFEG